MRCDTEPGPRRDASGFLIQQRTEGVRHRRRSDAAVIDPRGDLHWIEPQQVTPLQERDAALGYQAPHVARADTEVLRDSVEVQQPRRRATVRPHTRPMRYRSPRASLTSFTCAE